MIEFFFDCSSPWTYLAFHNIQPLAAELNEPIEWKPVLVGGIFNRVNPSVYAMREQPVPSKMNYMGKDLQDWAQLAGLKICMPPKVFPVNSVKAMRACLWLAPQGKLVPFATAVFEAYWSNDEDISQDDVLVGIATSLDIEGHALLAGIAQADIKEQLKLNTEEAIERGAFGSPTLFLGEDMYFGNDRLPLLKQAILRKRQASRPS
jgi:2-hydroxychromene-2-carboxylate isomerase